jgi:NTP pyrophosphatase (non-canonical NTP hydrolase)
MRGITIRYLQEYIKSKDHHPELAKDYFLKLSEEVGELARAIHKNPPKAADGHIKDTIEEEICDVIYYTLAIANCYDIDVEKWIHIKEKINNEKYNSGIIFDPSAPTTDTSVVQHD